MIVLVKDVTGPMWCGEHGYKSKEGYSMKREYGDSPNGNPIGGNWVLRDPTDMFMGWGQYRLDLAAEFYFEIEIV